MILHTPDIEQLKRGKPVELVCEQCFIIFTRSKSEVRRALKGTRVCRFCSQDCSKAHSSKTVIHVDCRQCGSSFKKSETDPNVFCNRSCAASYNLKRRPRLLRYKSSGGNKSMSNICHECGIHRKGPRKYTACAKCRDLISAVTFARRRVDSFFSKHARHKYQLIRHHAHRVAKIHRIPKVCGCVGCGYTRKLELAHIKAISSFPKEALLAAVNDVTNLIYLCPNHHHDLDDGICLALTRIVMPSSVA